MWSVLLWHFFLYICCSPISLDHHDHSLDKIPLLKTFTIFRYVWATPMIAFAAACIINIDWSSSYYYCQIKKLENKILNLDTFAHQSRVINPECPSHNYIAFSIVIRYLCYKNLRVLYIQRQFKKLLASQCSHFLLAMSSLGHN